MPANPKHDGGAAFPSYGVKGLTYAKKDDGMSLRDYFAGQVIAGFLENGFPKDSAAAGAYEVADAMLAAREKANG